jgi:predicted nucleic acid-binding protein
VDTGLWSLALRRKSHDLNAVEEVLQRKLTELIREGRAVLIGPVRQEVLSGIREGAVYERLRDSLKAFPDEVLTREDFEQAAKANNTCRAAGVSGSPVDFLICAVALRRGMEIFTTDADFANYARCIPIRLFVAAKRVK